MTSSSSTQSSCATPQSAFDFEATTLDGQPFSLDPLRGRVLLVVNTASQCGFTPQFAGLEQLWKTYGERGLTVLGFPSNEFGGQDPGSAQEIAQFCEARFGVSFPMMAKGEVNGPGAHPLWRWLKAEAPGLLGTQGIKWNFTKFLIGRDGRVVARYAPTDTPASMAKDIEKALSA